MVPCSTSNDYQDCILSRIALGQSETLHMTEHSAEEEEVEEEEDEEAEISNSLSKPMRLTRCADVYQHGSGIRRSVTEGKP